MVRTAGSKNIPKTVSQLVALLKEAAEKEGVEISDVLKNQADAAMVAGKKVLDAGGTMDEAKKAANEKLSKFANLEIEIPDDEIDTFRCGSCQAVMASEMKVCPECGAELNW